MFCPKCGRRARPGDRFCSRCGARLISPDPAILQKKTDPVSADAPRAETPTDMSAGQRGQKPVLASHRSRLRASTREKESLDEWVEWYLSGANEKRSGAGGRKPTAPRADLPETAGDEPDFSDAPRGGWIRRIADSALLIGVKKRLALEIRKLPKAFRRTRERAGVYFAIARGRAKTEGARLAFAVREGAERLGERAKIAAKRVYRFACGTADRARVQMALRRRGLGRGGIQPETPIENALFEPGAARDENAFCDEEKTNRAPDALYLKTSESAPADEPGDGFAEEWAEKPNDEETFLERHLRAAIATGLLVVFAVFVVAWCRVSVPGQRLFAQLGLGGATGYIILGDECMEAGNYTRAVEHFYKALTKRADYDTAIRLANAYQKTGDAARETSALLLCVDRFGEHIEPYRRLKELYPSPTDRPDAVSDALLKGVSLFSDITLAY